MRKIYVDLSRINPSYAGGVSRFSLGLATALMHNLPEQVRILASTHNKDYLHKNLPNATFITYRYLPLYSYFLACAALASFVLRTPSVMKIMNVICPGPPDIAHSSAVVICPTSTLNFYDARISSILCVHDIQHEIHPENFSFFIRSIRWARYRLSCDMAKYIQVSSMAIKDDLIKTYGDKLAGKIFLAPEGFDKKLFATNLPMQQPQDVPSRFIYYPAQLWKHKNHATVIAGLAHYNHAHANHIALVLTGKDYGELKHITSLAKQYGTELHYLGLVPEAQMRWLYKHAICAIAAGYHESSSLPIREALACGGRALAADIPPNMEIKDLQGLWLFNAYAPASFSAQLAEIISTHTPQPKSRMISEFEWNTIAAIYQHYALG